MRDTPSTSNNQPLEVEVEIAKPVSHRQILTVVESKGIDSQEAQDVLAKYCDQCEKEFEHEKNKAVGDMKSSMKISEMQATLFFKTKCFDVEDLLDSLYNSLNFAENLGLAEEASILKSIIEKVVSEPSIQ